MTIETPGYVLITSWIEVLGCLVIVPACLALVRRGPVAAAVGAVGALLAGISTGLSLIAYETGRWSGSDRFWEMASYARAIGLALLAVAVVHAVFQSARDAG